MASSQSPNRVYFTSFDRQPTDTNTDFTITFDTPIQNAYNFEVVQASFPNLLKPFARYETILYFYHEAFFNGTIALGVPMSISQFPGATGEALPVTAGRETYIDGRFFADGAALATYLTNWVQSLDTAWPATGTGLQPFYYPNDDPTETPVFLASNTTGITFTNLSFTYDDLTTEGTLKLTFADSTPLIVRVASTFDFGSLTLRFPSQLGYKLGFTAIQPEAFSTNIVSVTPANNQFKIGYTNDFVTVTDNNNTFIVFATPDTTYADSSMPVTIPTGSYPVDDFPGVLQAAMRATSPRLANTVVTQAAGVLSIALNFSGTPVSPPGVMGLNFTSGQGGTADGPACAALLGYTTFTPVPFILQQTFGAFTFVADVALTSAQGGFVTTQLTIPPNDYTVGSLAAKLQELITSPVANSLFPYFDTSVVANVGGQLVFTFGATNPPSGVANYGVAFSPADPSEQGGKTLLGFVNNFNVGNPLNAPNLVPVIGVTIAPDFHAAPDPINLTRTSLVYFASSLSSGESLASAGRKDILFAVAVTSGVGQIQQYQSSLSGIIINRPPSTIRNIRLTLLDDNFQILEPLPQNAAIITEIHFAYNEDAMANTRDKATTNIYA
jgi:hypothetical protein